MEKQIETFEELYKAMKELYPDILMQPPTAIYNKILSRNFFNEIFSISEFPKRKEANRNSFVLRINFYDCQKIYNIIKTIKEAEKE